MWGFNFFSKCQWTLCVFLHNKIGRPSFSYMNLAILKFKYSSFCKCENLSAIAPLYYLNFIPLFHSILYSAQFNVEEHKLYAKMCHFHLIVVTQFLFFFFLNKVYMNGTEQNNSNNYTREWWWEKVTGISLFLYVDIYIWGILKL